jgi:glycosyltransferase involved in cell wall biosynthesis
MKPKNIVLIIPSLSPGGMERVMIELAHFLSSKPNIKLSMISITNTDVFYTIPQKMEFYTPVFLVNQYNRFTSLTKTFFFLRKTLKKINPDVLLSFGGKYNSFVLLASSGLKINTFISDRSKPDISYGFFLDILNPITYKKATGIIAQTQLAKQILFERTNHKNISVIPNPVKIQEANEKNKENYILNVGRFVSTKQQELLVDYFALVVKNSPNWKLVFIGDGPQLQKTKEKAIKLKIADSVIFVGLTDDVEYYYKQSSIFAFTSISEGFPNVLLEAMSHGLACISFNCNAGPSELIDEGINGFLIPENNAALYIEKLQLLMSDNELRCNFGNLASQKAKHFNMDTIGEKFLQFLLNTK